MKKIILSAFLLLGIINTAFCKPILALSDHPHNSCIGYWVVYDDKTGFVMGSGMYNKCPKKNKKQKTDIIKIVKLSINNEDISKKITINNSIKISVEDYLKYFNKTIQK